MTQTATFKCPSCGAYLEFDPNGQEIVCPYCGYTGDETTHQAAEGETHLHGYHCQTCGAEIVADETTSAMRCYYCHSPVLLTDRLSNDFKPDGLIPFALDKEAARKKFDAFIASKKFIDHGFFTPRQLEDFTGVYYPYWVADVEGTAEFTGTGTKVSHRTTAREHITTTRYYRVERKGRVVLRNLVRKALSKTDRKLTDGIDPFDPAELTAFNMGYLSGFQAEMYDVPKEEAQKDMLEESVQHAHSLMSANTGYNSLRGQTSYTDRKVNTRYVLLPAWVLTYQGGKGKTPYYYMMNGRTGEVCGRLPVNGGKLFAWCTAVGAAVCAALMLGGALLW